MVSIKSSAKMSSLVFSAVALESQVEHCRTEHPPIFKSDDNGIYFALYLVRKVWVLSTLIVSDCLVDLTMARPCCRYQLQVWLNRLMMTWLPGEPLRFAFQEYRRILVAMINRHFFFAPSWVRILPRGGRASPNWLLRAAILRRHSFEKIRRTDSKIEDRRSNHNINRRLFSKTREWAADIRRRLHR